ncbi:MAG: methionine ABC transporter permease [Candidatus Izemoplasmataceae bacterium]|uniref:methionine ABC transporter permease n=1 Tax=Liberiplasma polymorphum TaxID=3374570 RepID=UPI00377097F9
MIDFDTYLNAFNETLYMTIISTLFVFVFGLILGISLYVTSKDGLIPNHGIYAILSVITSIGRSIPFLILIVLLLPLTRIIVGTILGPSAAIPALVIGATPFYARLVELALFEKGKELKETGISFGATNLTIILKILIPESKASLIRGITVTAIAITGYTSIAGAIGAGGLGNLAYLYGYARNRQQVTLIATFLIVALILIIQLIGDVTVKKLTHK